MYRLNLSVLFKGAGKSSALFARYFSQPTTTHTSPQLRKKIHTPLISVRLLGVPLVYRFLFVLTKKKRKSKNREEPNNMIGIFRCRHFLHKVVQ